MYGPKWPFLLMYVSRDTRRTDFSEVDGLSTRHPGIWGFNENKEKKAREDVKVAEDELLLAREELQAVNGDLCAKVTTLHRVCHEALEA